MRRTTLTHRFLAIVHRFSYLFSRNDTSASTAPRSSTSRVINSQPPRPGAGRTPSQILAHYWNAGTKRPDDLRSCLSLSNGTTPDRDPFGDALPVDDTEAQMRRALGLYGVPRRPEAERAAAPMAPRHADRFSAGGQRRRFAQEGDVPVTVLHGRRDHLADAPVNRLEAAETVVATERAAREQAERALAEAQASASKSDECHDADKATRLGPSRQRPASRRCSRA
jgi:hypothetical protein